MIIFMLRVWHSPCKEYDILDTQGTHFHSRSVAFSIHELLIYSLFLLVLKTNLNKSIIFAYREGIQFCHYQVPYPQSQDLQ